MPDIIIKSDFAEPKRPKRSRDTEVDTISLLGSDGTVRNGCSSTKGYNREAGRLGEQAEAKPF